MTGVMVIQKLYDYHYWATALLLDKAATVSEADYHAPTEFSEGGLHHTLFHSYETDWAWGMGCRTGEIPPDLPPTTLPTLETLRAAWQQDEQIMRAYLATLDDADLTKEITFHEPDGKTFTRTLYLILMHIVLHGHQHRAEVAALLTRYGASPGDLDLTRMLYD
jgi:uncharacterized damage-inducible protein DinB